MTFVVEVDRLESGALGLLIHVEQVAVLAVEVCGTLAGPGGVASAHQHVVFQFGLERVRAGALSSRGPTGGVRVPAALEKAQTLPPGGGRRERGIRPSGTEGQQDGNGSGRETSHRPLLDERSAGIIWGISAE